MGPSFLLALEGDLQNFIVCFTETFNQTTLESYSVVGFTETPVYCRWEEANKWIPLPSGCGAHKVSHKRFHFKRTPHPVKALVL